MRVASQLLTPHALRAALLLCEAEQQTQNRIERVRYLVEAAELPGTTSARPPVRATCSSSARRPASSDAGFARSLDAVEPGRLRQW